MAKLHKKYRKLADGTKVFKGFYARWHDRSRRPRQKEISLSTKDEQQARLKLAQLELKQIAGEFDPWKDRAPKEGVTVERAAQMYLSERDREAKAGHLSPRTARADRSVVDLFTAACPPGLAIAHAQREHVEDFLAASDISGRSFNTYVARLSGFFSWAQRRGLIADNPASEIRRRREGGGKESGAFPYLTRNEFDRLITQIEFDAEKEGLKDGEVVWLADFCKVMVGTGLRPGEMCALSWHWISDLYGEAPMIHIHIREGEFVPKWRRERTVPLAGRALGVVQRLHSGSGGEGPVFRPRRSRRGDKGRISSEYVSKRFVKYRREARLPDSISLHSLRHTYASWLVIAGVDLYRVQRLLGHRSIETTMRYAHLAPASMRSDVQRVFG